MTTLQQTHFIPKQSWISVVTSLSSQLERTQPRWLKNNNNKNWGILHAVNHSTLSTDALMLKLAREPHLRHSSLFCLFGFLTSSSTTRLYRGRAPRQERLTILRAATHETELGDHDFCLSRSHYTDTDPTCRERAATAGIEPGTSSPGVARSTAELPRPRHSSCG